MNDFFLFDIDLVTPTCLVRWDAHRTVLTQVAFSMASLLFFLPVVCKFLWGCLFVTPGAWLKHAKAQFDYKTGPLGEQLAKAINDCLTLIDVMAPGLMYNALAILRCDPRAAARESSRKPVRVPRRARRHDSLGRTSTASDTSWRTPW